MRNKDALYVSNATSVEIAKALQYFRLTVATVNADRGCAECIFAAQHRKFGSGTLAPSLTPAIRGERVQDASRRAVAKTPFCGPGRVPRRYPRAVGRAQTISPRPHDISDITLI
jgi:hypothetical protein